MHVAGGKSVQLLLRHLARLVVAHDGELLRYLGVGGVSDLEDAAAGLKVPQQDARQRREAVGIKNEIDIGVAALEAVGDMLLLGHAAAQSDDKVAAALLFPLQAADVAENAVLGVFAHGTGVENGHIGTVGIIDNGKAAVGQNALDALAVIDVLLAAVGAHGRCRVLISGQHELPHAADRFGVIAHLVPHFKSG